MDEAILKFINQLKTQNFADRTITFHIENLNAIRKIFGLQKIETKPFLITREIIKEKVILFMVNNKFKPNTINGRIKTLKKFFSFLFKEKYLSVNPTSDLEKVRGETCTVEAFTKDQVTKLMEQPDQETFTGYRDYTIMALMLDTGIRLSELCKLLFCGIDLMEGTMKVNSKGSSGDVPISQKCCRIIEKYLSYRSLRQPSCDNIFINLYGTPLNRRTIQDQFNKYGKKANIVNVRVSPHTMRHTFAKHYILGGGDAFSLQKILRHKNMDTVRIYVNLWGGEVKKQHNKFSPLVNF